jgi:hypothetical protein
MTELIDNWTRRTALVALGASGLAPMASAAEASATSTELSSLGRVVEALRLAMLAETARSSTYCSMTISATCYRADIFKPNRMSCPIWQESDFSHH